MVVAFLCRRGLLRCVAVALFVVVAWVEVLNPFVCLSRTVLCCRRRRRRGLRRRRRQLLVCFICFVVVVVVGRRRRRRCINFFPRYFVQGSP